VKKAALAVLVLALCACAGRGAPGTDVDLGEFFVTPGTDVLSAGPVELTVENFGEFSHTLVISDASGTVIAATDLVRPEAETLLNVNLKPGTYMFTCRIVIGREDGSIVDHYQQGMAASIEVVATAS